MRRRLRDVVHLIDRTDRAILYSNFEDDFGVGAVVELPGTSGVDKQSFKRKARAFLRAHEDSVALVKVRTAKPLTATDIASLETMLIDAGIGTKDNVRDASAAADGFGNFLRSLVGLDRKAASAAFEEFLSDTASPNQIEFIGMIVDHLTQNGAMDPALLYESPFIDIAPLGPEDKVVRLMGRIDSINRTEADDAIAS